MRTKKNILAFILVFVMIFANVSPVLAKEIKKPLTISEVSVEKFENNKDAEVEFCVKNTTDQDVSAKLIIGLYESESNKMIAYNYVSDKIGANQMKNWGACVPIPATGEYTIKAFAWDKMENPKTISNVVSVNKNQQTLTIEEQVQTAIHQTAAHQLKIVDEPQIGSIGGEWTVFSLARANYEVPENYYENYYSKVVDQVKKEHSKSENRWDNKVTDVERVIIALSSIGKDPSNVDGVNLLDCIWNKEGSFPEIKPDGVLGNRQGSNELIFGLLALDARNYKQSDHATITRDEIIHKILHEYQLESGGFGLSDKATMDFDITAMAIQALAPYYNKNSEVKVAIDKAIDILSEMQGDDGKFVFTFNGEESKPSESIAQTIVALTAMNIDPHTDSRFVKKGNSLITALLKFYDHHGGFEHVIGDGSNSIATEQGLYALVAYDRFVKVKNSLYNMTDVLMKDSKIGKAKLSIEKRTIGKGDLLPMIDVDLYKNDTPWDVVKRIADQKGIDIQYKENSQYNSVYISSIAGDGEFDHGSGSGWKYEVNGVFPNVGVSAYDTLKDQDVIRFRYCITSVSEELNKPLVDLLKSKIEEAKEFKKEKYTKETFSVLENAIQSAQIIRNDSNYDSKETDKELVVSTEIGKLNTAINGLVKINNLPPTSNEVPDDFENDLWLNTNFQLLNMGEQYVLTSRRVPEIIDGAISNNITHPHYTYKIIEGDSVTLQNTNDSNMTITAVKEGTSIIEVGYEKTTANGNNYGAVSNVNKSYMIVDVVTDKNNDHGITLDTDIKTRSYDTIYYNKGNTVDYSFHVNSTGSDRIEVTCNGKLVEGSGNEYTVPLENRSNIIGITAIKGENKKKLYYVIDARKIEIKIENNSRPNEDIAVGDEVKVSFRGITPPIYKLATIYNPTWYAPNSQWGPTYGTTVRYNNSDLGEIISYDNVQYELANHNAMKFTVTEEKTYKFTNGHINCEWWGSSLGAEKDMTGPGNPNLGAPTNHDDFSTLPDFEIEVKKAIIIPATGIEITEKNKTVEEKETVSLIAKVLPENVTQKGIKWSSDHPEVAKVDENGVVTGVKPGKAIVTATSVDGNFTDTCEITVIDELPATQEEKKELKDAIDEAKSKDTDEYSMDTRKILQEEIDKAENIFKDKTVLIAKVNEAKESLKNAIKGLKINYAYGMSVSPKIIKAGDEVTITIPKISDPVYKDDVLSLKTVYSSNIKGLDKIESNEAKGDANLLKTITFTIPKSVQAGEYTLTNGHVYKQWKGPYFPPKHLFGQPEDANFYEGELPEIKITVADATQNIPVTNINFDEETVYLAVYGTKSLHVNIDPKNATDQDINWSSNDENIATVNSKGEVKALSEGTAIITATSSSDPSIKATCKIVVNKKTVSDGIEITKKDLNQNDYDIFYYVEGKDYMIEGQPVTFISESQVKYGENIVDLKNKKITYTITAGTDDVVSAGETITIEFNKLKTPIGQVSGKWNMYFGGEVKSVYDTDIEGISEIRSESGDKKINTLTFKIPADAKGEYHLKNGRIFEKANPYSPGIDGIGTEGYFGKLPDITITVK